MSKASTNIQDTSKQDNTRLQKEMFVIQQVATDAGKELSEYFGKVESNFMTDTFSAAESHAIMENCLQEW